jgi:RHS repeat-associated protein
MKNRYGFNGQEMDNEISGSGNSYTAEFWQYDPRLGRRWNLDPKPQVGLSRYSVMNDSPIWLTDPNGDCPPGVKCDDVVGKPEISADNGGKNNNRVGRSTTRNHKGVDIIAPKGADIKAVMGGEVFKVINNHQSDEYSGKRNPSNPKPSTTGLGNTVIIKTTLSEDYTYQMDGGKSYTIKKGETVFIKYSHLDIGKKILEGTKIHAGTIIGTADATGNPGFFNGQWGIKPEYRHVHIEARIGDAFGEVVDPEGFMNSTFDEKGNRKISK